MSLCLYVLFPKYNRNSYTIITDLSLYGRGGVGGTNYYQHTKYTLIGMCSK